MKSVEHICRQDTPHENVYPGQNDGMYCTYKSPLIYHQVDNPFASCLYFSASRNISIKEIAIIYPCVITAQDNEDNWVYQQHASIHCFCNYGDANVTNVPDLMTSPLGTCINRAKLMKDGWANVKDLRIATVNYLSDTGHYFNNWSNKL